MNLQLAQRASNSRQHCTRIIGLLLLIAGLRTPSVVAQTLTGNLSVHDQSTIMKQDGVYYTFYTAQGIRIKTSPDRINWSTGPRVFASNQIPAWTSQNVPANTGNFWAPDIAHFNGLYHLYYSVSSFGSQDSAIGLATSPTLNPADANYAWTDQGPVIQSNPGQNPYNAIDPAITQSSDGKVWMSFGSFWSGIYLTELDPATGKRITANSPSYNIARHITNPPDAIEASYIYERDGYFYQFVNWDTCCQGVNSTYNIRVGRGTSITGPYVDKSGVNMMQGGGTPFLGTLSNFIGPGHASIFTDEGGDWFSYHYYDGLDNGTSKLNIRRLFWDENGWPTLSPPKPAVIGDYNFNGTVDAADYVLWRDTLGSLTDLRADGTGNLIVDGNDYRPWRTNFGNPQEPSAPASATIPEPATWLLILAAIGASSTRRKLSMRLRISAHQIAVASSH